MTNYERLKKEVVLTKKGVARICTAVIDGVEYKVNYVVTDTDEELLAVFTRWLVYEIYGERVKVA